MLNNVEQDSQNIDLLTDYLYVDQQKLYSLIAQLVRSGLLTHSTEEFGSNDSEKGNIGLNMFVKGDIENVSQQSQKIVRTYNSEYTLPTLLLDLLSENQFIKTDATNVDIGSLVLVSGEYRLFDTSILEKIVPLISMMPDINFNTKDQKVFKKLLDLFPKNLQLDLVSDENVYYWSALKKEYLQFNIEDFLLLNGINNKGRWYILGLLENKPHQQVNSKFKDRKTEISGLYEEMKKMIGKSENSYGITPILIFRKIPK